MIERNQIDHLELVLLGKTMLLLVERQELLVNLRAMTQRTEEVAPTDEISKHLDWSDVECPNWRNQRGYGQRTAS